MNCPHCQSDEVETTVHLLFRRQGSLLELLREETGVETCCNNCGQGVEDEDTEQQLRRENPDWFPRMD